ncbi:hypothetical protein E3O21_09890 [Cryobacterium flavum]|uniref:Uncharacterized protein n=1 Tax=Cryobacterium flavum TaxID=1424659 RepID=A0ABY2I1P5_9MICO|nr:hypothetical protein [Cryobacterium flavum]TFB77194.1 hypothetical protein E3O21_09890 [Cryobacterium flavum]
MDYERRKDVRLKAVINGGVSENNQTGYSRRVIDTELDDLFPALSAIALEGPKGVDKTATAERRVATIFRMDALNDLERIRASPRHHQDIPAAGSHRRMAAAPAGLGPRSACR